MANPAGDNLTKLTQDIFDRFKESTLPLLEDLQAGMDTRREDYYNISLESADKLAKQKKAQAELRSDAMGYEMTGAQEEAQTRQESLGRTVTEAAGVNASVDAADEVNKNIAADLMNIATGVESNAMSNLSASAGMASTRQQQGLMNKQQAQQANTQATASMIGLVAAMMM